MISRVAIRLDKSDIIDWLVEEIEENQIPIDLRVKKLVNIERKFFEIISIACS